MGKLYVSENCLLNGEVDTAGAYRSSHPFCRFTGNITMDGLQNLWKFKAGTQVSVDQSWMITQ